MTTLPATLALTLSTVALAATATTADAKPHRTKRGPTARPLLRAKPVANVAPVVPLVAASERPVCGNIATKGPTRRSCVDPVGTSYYVESYSRVGTWELTGRHCATRHTKVDLDATGRASVILNDNTRTAERIVVEAGATSTEPLVAECRKGLK